MPLWLKQSLAIGALGACGALARFGLMQAMANWQFLKLPVAITVINIVGCALAGWGNVALAGKSWLGLDVKLVISVGFLGALTTYATFIAEGSAILSVLGTRWALGYWIGQTILGFAIYWAVSSLAVRTVA